MDDFGFGRMSDDEFRKEFLKFMNMYRSGMDNYFNSLFGSDDLRSRRRDSFMGDDFFEKILSNLNDLNTTKGFVGDDGWERKSWSSPDGSYLFNYYTKSFGDDTGSKPNKKQDPSNVDTLKLLESKLNKAIMDEKYEEAAIIRDLMNSLKEDNKKENK